MTSKLDRNTSHISHKCSHVTSCEGLLTPPVTSVTQLTPPKGGGVSCVTSASGVTGGVSLITRRDLPGMAEGFAVLAAAVAIRRAWPSRPSLRCPILFRANEVSHV